MILEDAAKSRFRKDDFFDLGKMTTFDLGNVAPPLCCSDEAHYCSDLI